MASELKGIVHSWLKFGALDYHEHSKLLCKNECFLYKEEKLSMISFLHEHEDILHFGIVYSHRLVFRLLLVRPILATNKLDK